MNSIKYIINFFQQLPNKVNPLLILLLISSFSFYCKKKSEPAIEILEPTLYEFLFYSGFYKKDQVVVSFKNHDIYKYTIGDQIVRELTVTDVFKKKLKEDTKAEDNSEFYEAEIKAINEQDNSIVLIKFGRDKDYKIKIQPTTIIPFEFQHKGESVNLLNDGTNFQILNYAIFRGNEQLRKIEEQPANDIIREANSNQPLLNYLRDIVFKDVKDRSVYLSNAEQFKDKLFLILDNLVGSTVKTLNFEAASVHSNYRISYADSFLMSLRSKICLDNSLFISSILSRFFEYKTVLFYIKTKDVFHVFTGVTQYNMYTPGEKATVFLLESNQGETKNTIDKLKETDLARLFRIELNDLKDCSDSKTIWSSKCQFIGKVNIELPKEGFIIKTNNDKIGILSFYNLTSSDFLSAPEEGTASEENYDAINHYRKTYIKLSDSNPQNYQRDEIFVVENMYNPIKIVYNTGLECIVPITSSGNIDFGTNVSENSNCLQETQFNLNPIKERVSPYIYHFSIKAWGKKIPNFPMIDRQGVKSLKTFIKNYEMVIDSGSNYYFDKYSACLIYGDLDRKSMDKKEIFDHCFEKKCSPDYFCKNIDLKKMEKPKILQLHYENLDKDQYIWIMYELKKI